MHLGYKCVYKTYDKLLRSESRKEDFPFLDIIDDVALQSLKVYPMQKFAKEFLWDYFFSSNQFSIQLDFLQTMKL